MRIRIQGRTAAVAVTTMVVGLMGAVAPLTSAAAETLDVTAPGAPAVTLTAGDGTYDVAWTLADDGGESPDGWQVDHRVSGADTWETTDVDAADTSVDLDGINGTTYEVQVRAHNSAGWGESSPVDTVTPVASPPKAPSAPKDVTAVGGVESVTVSWTAPADPGAGLTGYRIDWRVSGGSWTSVAVASTAVQKTVYVPGDRVVETRIVASNAAGDSAAVTAPSVDTQALLVSSSLSASSFRPFKDGYQDTVTAKAKTAAVVPVTMKVRNPAGTTVRTLDVGTGKSFSQAWNGLNSSGKRVPVGTYTVQLVAAWDGPTKILLSKTVKVVLSQVGTPTVSRPFSTVYPVKDGYRDHATFTVHASLPAHGTLTVTKGGKVAYRKSLSTGRSWKPTWNGKLHGSVVTGSYKVTVSLKGGEGKARTHHTSVSVSKKRLVSRTKSVWYSAQSAFDRCWGAGTFDCTATHYYINGANRSAVEYYTGSDPANDLLWSSHSLPLPNGGAHVQKWRLAVEASTDDSTYVVIYCPHNALDVKSCGKGGRLPTWDDGIFVGTWTGSGVSDGRANFAVASEDWGLLYVSRYRLDVKYQVLA